MGEKTGISWCDHTFNPLWGCTKVSPACDFCYAETWDKRLGGDHWGPHAEFREFGDAHWNEPLKWDRAAARDGVRRSVFCASMADVFDKRWPEHVRPRLWSLIQATPNLDWLLLTKRPENVVNRLPPQWYGGRDWPNVIFGVTVESTAYLKRAWTLSGSLGDGPRWFISYEPALGPLGRLRDIWVPGDKPRLTCVIAGGESGANARPSHPAWFRDARDQCAEMGIGFHFKQWGEWLPDQQSTDPTPYAMASVAHSFGDIVSTRVGKKRAGRLLDGVEHNATVAR